MFFFTKSAMSAAVWNCVFLSLRVAGGPKVGPAPAAVSAADVEKAKAKDPSATPEALEAGRALFVAKCNQCHGYPDRDGESVADWPGILDEMAKRAKLSDAEHAS